MKTQIKLLMTSGLLFSASAFAQHGGANGPVITGSLNPASGATTLLSSTVHLAELQCYGSLLNDMFEPFLNQSHYSQNLKLDVITDTAWFDFKLLAANPAPLNQSLLIKHLPYAEASIELPAYGGPNLYIYVNEDRSSTQLSSAGLPFVDEHAIDVAVFDPLTHIQTGTQKVATTLDKVYSDAYRYVGEAPPTPDAIPVLNSQGTQTNFKMNGKKFFECVESKL